MAVAPSKVLMVQLALRAIRRVHLDHQAFNLARQPSPADHEAALRQLNVGPGIEVAYEDYVRVALASEFQQSKLTWGWVVPDDDDPRHYEIETQRSFNVGSERQLIDLVYWRVDPKRVKPYPIGPVEMKRARRFKVGAATAEESNLDDVADDIKKLCRLARASDVEMHPHVLVWGETSEDPSPYNFIDRAFDKAGKGQKYEVQVDWMPIEWSRPTSGFPTVNRWLWVAYAEIDTAR
jgi:hypothetical protein